MEPESGGGVSPRTQCGLRVTGRGSWEVSCQPLGPPARGEVTVAAEYLGICGSDLHRIFDAGAPAGEPGLGWPGHEIAGRVVDCPSGLLQAGEQVLVVPVPARARGFVDILNIDESRLIPLGTSLGTFRGVLCQQIGTVIHALKRFCPGSAAGTAVVVGGGSAGQAFTALLKRRGFRPVIAADRSRGRLEVCRIFGADETVHVPAEDLESRVHRLTGGRGAALVVEAAGTPQARRLAMGCVGFRGTVGFFGLPGGTPVEEFPFASLFARQARLDMITGTQNEPGLASLREAIDLVERGELPVAEMVSHRFRLDQIGTALETARDIDADGTRKVLIELG